MKKNNEMTLSECAKFDYQTGQAQKKTGWGMVCSARCKDGTRKRARIGKPKHPNRKPHQAFCQMMAAKGFINDVDGKFIPKQMAKENSMRRDYFAGYKQVA